MGREFTSFLFNKEDFIGEVRVRVRADDQSVADLFSGKVMRVSDFSPPSERCQPLLVMHAISDGAWFTLDSVQADSDELKLLYSSCLHEAKTAMVQLGNGLELHLVAMKREKQQACFWGYTAAEGAYLASLTMLNLRCLALVFDLDETLLVANTMRSFEDRIDAVHRKIRMEVDRDRIAAFTAEVQRFQEDQALLAQYIDSDSVDGGKFKAQNETVSYTYPALERPVLRLDDRSVILTRINPAARYTSVLVRLRPGWEELRNYLIAKGRKRFEVFICTMSEKDYALEMWRLLDPDARLIPSVELQERIVCVKGAKKSLANVFQRGQCHPRMSMVIDDRLDVWKDVDSPRVHVVPAFAPYYAPQAETSGLPVLCIAKNVVSKVRGGFFKDFDDSISQHLSCAEFDTDGSTLPKPLDVSDYLTLEKTAQDVVADSKDLPNGMADSETETAVNPQARSRVEDGSTQLADNRDLPGEPCENWEEGEVPESEVDPNTRRRFLILQHGQDKERNRAAGSSSVWDENEMSPGRPGTSDTQETDSQCYDGGQLGLMRAQKQDRKLLEYSDTDYRLNGARETPQPDPTHPVSLLQNMAQKYKGQLEFRSSVSPTVELQFCVEALFNGDKVARGFGRTNKDARTRAAEDALRLLSNEFRDKAFITLLPEKQTVQDVPPPAQTKLPSFNAVAALKDLCAVESLSVNFRELQIDSNPLIHSCEVEVSGRVMGRGRGLSWEAAKQEASEEALRSMNPKNSNKRNPPPRSPPPNNNKRMRLGSGRGQGRGNTGMSPRKPAAVRLK